MLITNTSGLPFLRITMVHTFWYTNPMNLEKLPMLLEK